VVAVSAFSSTRRKMPSGFLSGTGNLTSGKAAFESGQIADLNTPTMKQLHTLAKQNGVSIARTKAEFIKLLDQAEPGFNHTNLTGAALKAKLKEHKIGLLRTKDDLVKLLAEKQTAQKQARQLAEQLKKVPAAGGLQDLTVVELKEMAKAIFLNMTKQDGGGRQPTGARRTVLFSISWRADRFSWRTCRKIASAARTELLDELEPGVDHSGLKGKALIAAKKKHHIGPLKNKQQLIKALQKAADEELAEKAKQERKRNG